MFVCDKNVTGLLFYCKFHLDLHLTLLCSCLLQNDLFKGMLGKNFFKHNYCQACHTRFAVVFTPLSSCVRSLIITTNLEFILDNMLRLLLKSTARKESGVQ